MKFWILTFVIVNSIMYFHHQFIIIVWFYYYFCNQTSTHNPMLALNYQRSTYTDNSISLYTYTLKADMLNAIVTWSVQLSYYYSIESCDVTAARCFHEQVELLLLPPMLFSLKNQNWFLNFCSFKRRYKL